MKKIAIMTDSSSGITEEEAKQYDIVVMPLHVIINDSTDILDTPENMEKYRLYEIMGSQRIKTSQVSQYDLEQKYDELLKQYDQVIHYPIAEKLSGQYASAVVLASKDKYKDRIFVVQNHTAAFALKKLAFYAHTLVIQGLSVSEIIEKTNVFEKEVFMAMIPGSVDQLASGGRAKKILISLITLLKIRILLEWGANPHRVASSRTVGKLMATALELFKTTISKYTTKYKFFVLKSAYCRSSVWNIILEELKKDGIEYSVDKIADIFCMHAGIDTIGIVGYPDKYEF